MTRAGWCCMTDACIFTTEPRRLELLEQKMADTKQDELTAPPRMPSGVLPRFDTPLVPRNSISGRALVAVVAIMTFLASLTTGAVMLVGQAASEWQADVAREVTIQVIPASWPRYRGHRREGGGGGARFHRHRRGAGLQQG